jgi:hypothetical protein
VRVSKVGLKGPRLPTKSLPELPALSHNGNMNKLYLELHMFLYTVTLETNRTLGLSMVEMHSRSRLQPVHSKKAIILTLLPSSVFGQSHRPVLPTLAG